MKINLDLIHERLATTSVISGTTCEMFRKLALAVDDRHSSIRQFKRKGCAAHVIRHLVRGCTVTVVVRMSEDYVPRKRDWHEIAAEASVEKDATRLQRLADELEHARDERDELKKTKSA
jgi:hypothetical protein